MKKIIVLCVVALLCALAYHSFGVSKFAKGVINENTVKSKKKAVPELQFGDIIFQSSTSGQSLAIQLATKSKYSHVGMLFKQDKEWMVLEAVQPVKITPLSVWKTHGDDHEYEVKRLINSESLLTEEVINDMTQMGEKWVGKDYDIYFDWSDDELYCSELVWKLYEENLGLEIGALRPLRDFDLSSPVVKKIMKRRYGNNIPLESMMISPRDMFDSELLEVIEIN